MLDAIPRVWYCWKQIPDVCVSIYRKVVGGVYIAELEVSRLTRDGTIPLWAMSDSRFVHEQWRIGITSYFTIAYELLHDCSASYISCYDSIHDQIVVSSMPAKSRKCVRYPF